MSDWISQGETILYDKDTFFFTLEEFRRASPSGAGKDQMIFVHATVHKFTPSVFKEMLRVWEAFRRNVTCPIYAIGALYDNDPDKFEHFVTRLGFRYLQDVVCENGAERRLYIHQKQEAQSAQRSHIVNHKQQSDPRNVHQQQRLSH